MTYPINWPDPGVMHFRLAEDRLGYLDLDCDHGYVVQSYDLGFPTVREVIYPNSLDDGTYDLTRFWGPRSITLDIALKPHVGVAPNSSPLPPEPVLRDNLLAYANPALRPTLIFSEHQDERVKRVMVRGAEASIAMTRENYNKMNVSFIAPRGVLRSWDERCYHYTFSSATSDTQTYEIENTGTVPSPWRAYLRGEAVKPRFLLNGELLLELDYTSEPGAEIVIDSLSKTVTIDGVQTGFTYVGDSATWFPVPVGKSTLTIEQDTYTTEGYPFAFWQMPGTSSGGLPYTDVLYEPFNNFTAAPWVLAGAPTIVAGRTGTAGQFTTSSQTADFTIPTAVQSDTLTLGLAWKASNFASANTFIAEFNSDAGATNHNYLRINSAGNILVSRGSTILTSAPHGMVAGNWYYIEAQIRLHDTAGSAVVKINGTTVINVSGVDTKNAGTKAVYDQLRILGTAAVTAQFDDLYLSSGGSAPFKGDPANIPPTDWAIPPGTTPPNNPPPIGKPPWAWTTRVDPETGLPSQLSIDFCFFDSFI